MSRTELAKKALLSLFPIWENSIKKRPWFSSFFSNDTDELNAIKFLRSILNSPNPKNSLKDQRNINKNIATLLKGTLGNELSEWVAINPNVASNILPYELYKKIVKKNNFEFFSEQNEIFNQYKKAHPLDLEEVKLSVTNTIKAFREMLNIHDDNNGAKKNFIYIIKIRGVKNSEVKLDYNPTWTMPGNPNTIQQYLNDINKLKKEIQTTNTRSEQIKKSKEIKSMMWTIEDIKSYHKVDCTQWASPGKNKIEHYLKEISERIEEISTTLHLQRIPVMLQVIQNNITEILEIIRWNSKDYNGKEDNRRGKAYIINNKLAAAGYSAHIQVASPIKQLEEKSVLPCEKLYWELIDKIHCKTRSTKKSSRRTRLQARLADIFYDDLDSKTKYTKMCLVVQQFTNGIDRGQNRLFTRSSLTQDLKKIMQKIYNNQYENSEISLRSFGKR